MIGLGTKQPPCNIKGPDFFSLPNKGCFWLSGTLGNRPVRCLSIFHHLTTWDNTGGPAGLSCCTSNTGALARRYSRDNLVECQARRSNFLSWVILPPSLGQRKAPEVMRCVYVERVRVWVVQGDVPLLRREEKQRSASSIRLY